MKNKKLYALTSLATLAIALNPFGVSANYTVVDETGDWSKPTVIFGQNVDQGQKAQLLEDFLLKPNSYIEGTATTDDMAKYLGIDGSGSMFSSVAVIRTGKGEPVRVKITDSSLITKVTAEQYANAAITAGAKEVQIVVSAPFAVTGESALTGVYKAFENNGQKLDTARTQVAQQEIATASEIVATEVAENPEFNPYDLDAALAEIKVELGEHKQKNGGVADDVTVYRIVEDAISANSLEGVLSDDQIAQLVAFAKAYQDTSAVDEAELLKELGKFQDDVATKVAEFTPQAKEVAGKVAQGVSDLHESAKANGAYEKGKEFFNSLWESIKSVFSK